MKQEPKRLFAKPYDDIKTPFTIDDKGAFAEYVIQHPDDLPEHLAIGASVIITDIKKTSSGLVKYWVSGRIVGMKSISPFNPERENMLYQEEESENPFTILESLPGGPHNHQPMVLRIQLDQELESNETKDGYYISPIQRPPTALSRMFLPEMKSDDDRNPTLLTILNIKDSGISLGCVGSGNIPLTNERNEFLNYKLDVLDIENKHMFIVGESGSGKTVFLKNLAYEIRKFKGEKRNIDNRVIMVDVQGDIVQLLLPQIDNIVLQPRLSWQKDYNLSEERKAVDSADVQQNLGPFQLIIPKSSSGTLSKNLSSLKLLCKKFGIKVEEVSLRLQDLHQPSDVEYLFNVSSPQVAMLLDGLADWLKGQNRKVAIANLKALIQKGKSKVNNGSIMSEFGVPFYESTYGAAERALKSLSRYFDYDTEAIKDNESPLQLLKERGTSIIYLADLNTEERIMWEMQIVKWLNDNNDNLNFDTNNNQLGETYVFIDEAHQIIPAHPIGVADKETFDRLRSNFERLAREGRKFGINLILSTQSPKDLHEIVPEQCPNRVVMKINPRNAVYAFLDPELAIVASRFSYGQFWFQSPFNGTPNWIRIHSTATPIPHESVKKFWPKVIDAAKKIN